MMLGGLSYLENFEDITISGPGGLFQVINKRLDADSDTDITTACSLNSTSTDLGAQGGAARYACDNSAVNFIWQNNKLTMIELACPTSS